MKVLSRKKTQVFTEREDMNSSLKVSMTARKITTCEITYKIRRMFANVKTAVTSLKMAHRAYHPAWYITLILTYGKCVHMCKLDMQVEAHMNDDTCGMHRDTC